MHYSQEQFFPGPLWTRDAEVAEVKGYQLELFIALLITSLNQLVNCLQLLPLFSM